MRILVTGATGFVGSRLVSALRKAGHDVIPLDSKTGNLLTEEGLAFIKSKRFDAVYHLAAQLDEASPDLWKVNVDGTRNLLEVCKNRNIERFIFLGPIGALGETAAPSKEDDAYNPKTRYEQSKVEGEQLVINYRLRHQLMFTIVRSTIVYGPNAFWRQIFAAAREGYPIIGAGDNQFHLIYVDDLVSFLVLCLDPAARNQIYNLAGPDTHTYRETYKAICKALRCRFSTKTVNPLVAKAGAFAYLARARVRGEKPDVTMLPTSIDRLIRNRHVDISKAVALGYKPKYDLEHGLARTVKELGLAK